MLDRSLPLHMRVVSRIGGIRFTAVPVCGELLIFDTNQQFATHTYWQNQHGPLVKSVPEFMRHVRKYVQCHIVENSVPLGVAAPYDGEAELRFDSARRSPRPSTSRGIWRLFVRTSTSSLSWPIASSS